MSLNLSFRRRTFFPRAAPRTTLAIVLAFPLPASFLLDSRCAWHQTFTGGPSYQVFSLPIFPTTLISELRICFSPRSSLFYLDSRQATHISSTVTCHCLFAGMSGTPCVGVSHLLVPENFILPIFPAGFYVPTLLLAKNLIFSFSSLLFTLTCCVTYSLVHFFLVAYYT